MAAAAKSLRQRAEELNAPEDMRDSALLVYVEIKSAMLPEWELAEGGLYMKPLKDANGKDVPQRQQYMCYFDPVWDGSRLRLRCRVGGCGALNSFEVLSGDGKYEYPFTNSFKHLAVCPSKPPLTFSHSTYGSRRRRRPSASRWRRWSSRAPRRRRTWRRWRRSETVSTPYSATRLPRTAPMMPISLATNHSPSPRRSRVVIPNHWYSPRRGGAQFTFHSREWYSGNGRFLLYFTVHFRTPPSTVTASTTTWQVVST